MPDEIYCLPSTQHVALLFFPGPKIVANRIAEDVANSDLLASLLRGLRRSIEARYFASGIRKILARDAIAVS